jgi:hypothetical protein
METRWTTPLKPWLVHNIYNCNKEPDGVSQVKLEVFHIVAVNEELALIQYTCIVAEGYHCLQYQYIHARCSANFNSPNTLSTHAYYFHSLLAHVLLPQKRLDVCIVARIDLLVQLLLLRALRAHR